MVLPEKLIAPTRCTASAGLYNGDCGGTRFKREGSGDHLRFVCRKCGWEHRGRPVPSVDLCAAQCKVCDESFLYKRNNKGVYKQEVPDRCRACLAAQSARQHERAAEKWRKQAVTIRAAQRRALARWKPPESQAEAEVPRVRKTR